MTGARYVHPTPVTNSHFICVKTLIQSENSCAFVPAGGACRVRPVEGKLAPHPAAVQAMSTKL